MSLVIAIRNQTDVVIASDISDPAFIPNATRYGPVIGLANRCCVLIAGNLEAVRHAIADTALPRVTADVGAAAVAQIIRAALTLEVVPKLAAMTGRVEIIVAGIDPVRHTQLPGLYYLDSARGFNLDIIDSGAVAAGATAAVGSLLTGVRHDATHDQLTATVKEAYASTKLRWPEATANHLLIGTLTPEVIKYEVF